MRSVRSPEFQGITFHEVRARSVLNRVPGQSVVPFSWTVNPYRGCSHSCVYCLSGDTPILMADGRTKPLSAVRVGDEIYGTETRGARRHYVRTTVLAHWRTRKPAYRVELADGTRLVAGGDHRFLSDRGWKHVSGGENRPHLTAGARVMSTGGFPAPPERNEAYVRGYLHGTDGLLDDHGRKGFLAGVFDTAGTYAEGTLRLHATDPETTEAICLALKHLGFSAAIEDSGVRVLGGLGEHLRFLHTVAPEEARKLALDGAPVDASLEVRAVTSLGVELPMFDITTGTGDFIADGVVSHNCFARNTHTYLDFDSGADFDSQVVVKVNAAEVLASQLRRPSWRGEHVAMGTNTDPYQRAEGRYQLMPGIIRAFAEHGTPFSILTKGTTLSRDLPLLSSVSAEVDVGLGVSIAVLDRELHSSVEPGTPSPQARLELVRRIRDAGLPCGVMIAPVLPGLTDSDEHLDALLAAVADAGATSATVLALHLRPGAREWYAQWLAREFPALVPRYRKIYGRGSYAHASYRRTLAARVGPLLRRYGFGREDEASHRVPEPREAEPAPRAEQMRLL
ncbi:radical SAM protein [Amycolatopsis acidicola]|uniref:Radical SAM protein n=1 Tax=Amycolatopsis acidicola TaxID=2596893 RepID=A0A5N0UMR8_9PSEU|nr:radical SAM protein [Amycolatopsis acidicola]